MLSNLGSLTPVIALQLALIVVLLLLAGLTIGPCPIWGKKLAAKLGDTFFNPILAFIDGTFFMLVFMAMINVKEEYTKENVEKNSSYYCSLISLAVCFLELLCVPIYLCCNYEHLDDEKTKKRCGYAYVQLNYKHRGCWALSYPLFY